MFNFCSCLCTACWYNTISTTVWFGKGIVLCIRYNIYLTLFIYFCRDNIAIIIFYLFSSVINNCREIFSYINSRIFSDCCIRFSTRTACQSTYCSPRIRVSVLVSISFYCDITACRSKSYAFSNINFCFTFACSMCNWYTYSYTTISMTYSFSIQLICAGFRNCSNQHIANCLYRCVFIYISICCFVRFNMGRAAWPTANSYSHTKSLDMLIIFRFCFKR